MSFKGIFGATFFSVLAALVLYDLVIKGVVSGLMPNKYDNTYDPMKIMSTGKKSVKNFSNETERRKHLQDLIEGKEIRFNVAA